MGSKLLRWFLLLTLGVASFGRTVRIFMDPDPTATSSAWLNNWTPTFVQHLSDEVGRKLGQNITFQLIPYDASVKSMSVLVAEREIDFYFTQPTGVGCVLFQFDAVPIATIARYMTGTTTQIAAYGGAIVTKASNFRIQKLEDIKGAVVGMELPYSWAASLLQQAKLVHNGMYLYRDAVKVVVGSYTTDYRQLQIFRDLDAGDLDVAFVRADNMPNFAQQKLLNSSDFKVIAQVNATIPESGHLYPFQISTNLYAEWGVCAFPYVEEDIRSAVMEALFSINATSLPAKLGKYAGWNPAANYYSSILVLEDSGVITVGANHQRSCAPFSPNFQDYDMVQCPPGYFKVLQSTAEDNCRALNKTCPQGLHCWCSPCKFAAQFEVFAQTAGPNTACSKMQVCATAPQGRPIAWTLLDNTFGAGHNVSYRMTNLVDGSVITGVLDSKAAPWNYSADVTRPVLGTYLFEVSVDSVQIPTSPYLVKISPTACGEGSRRTADAETGACICQAGTVQIASDCVPLGVLLPAVLVPAIVLLAAAAAFKVYEKLQSADSVWVISWKELAFDDPPRILGRGTFGMVYSAEYRGTKVAVKRVRPCRRTSTSRGSGDMRLRASGDHRSASQCSANSNSMSTTASPASSFKTEQMSDGGDGDGEGCLGGWCGEVAAGCCVKAEPAWVSPDLARFVQEMRTLSKLRHPNITTVMGAVMRDEYGRMDPQLVMELMEHGSLYDLMQNKTVVIEGELLFSILRDVVQGMRFLHAASPPVVHADLKSGNVLIDASFRAKVSDFGMSMKQKVFGKATVAKIGTPAFMAPELITDGKLTPACDVYAFGIMLYEICSGKEPYDGHSVDHILKAVVHENMRPDIPQKCPAVLQTLMEECWSEAPEDRPGFPQIERALKDGRADVRSFHLDNVRRERRASLALSDIFPPFIAEALAEGRSVEPIVRDMVTIYVSDIVGYTTLSSKLEAHKVADMLNRLYVKFDAVSEKCDVYKIETIGDAYLATTNLLKDQGQSHAAAMARFALGCMRAAAETLVDESDPSLGCVRIRAGFHSGPVVAQVVGNKYKKFSLIGDSVNTASRMESTSVEGSIQCSADAAALIRQQAPGILLQPRGEIEVKGKGRMHTYFVVGEGDPPAPPAARPGLATARGRSASSLVHVAAGRLSAEVPRREAARASLEN